MKALILSIAAVLAVVALKATDGILISTQTKTVVVERKHEWRTITFQSSPDTGDITVGTVYEAVTREDGVVVSRDIIREATIPWSRATNISPSLVLVREELRAAMPLILTNTP